MAAFVISFITPKRTARILFHFGDDNNYLLRCSRAHRRTVHFITKPSWDNYNGIVATTNIPNRLRPVRFSQMFAVLRFRLIGECTRALAWNSNWLVIRTWAGALTENWISKWPNYNWREFAIFNGFLTRNSPLVAYFAVVEIAANFAMAVSSCISIIGA